MLSKVVSLSLNNQKTNLLILDPSDYSNDFHLDVLTYKNLLRETEDDPIFLTIKLFTHKQSIKLTNDESEIVSNMRLIFTRLQQSNHPCNQFGEIKIYLKDSEESTAFSEYYPLEHEFYPGAIALNLKYMFVQRRPSQLEVIRSGQDLYGKYLDVALSVLIKELAKKELYETVYGKSFYQLYYMNHSAVKDIKMFFENFIIFLNSRALFVGLSESEKTRNVQNLLAQKKYFDQFYSNFSKPSANKTQKIIFKIWKKLCKDYEVDRVLLTTFHLPS